MTLAGLALRAPGLDESLIGDELFTYEVRSTRRGRRRLGRCRRPRDLAAALLRGRVGCGRARRSARVAARPVVRRRRGHDSGGLRPRPPHRRARRGAGRRRAVRSQPVRDLLLGRGSPVCVDDAVRPALDARAAAALDGGRRLHWVLFALASWAALLSHYTAVFPSRRRPAGPSGRTATGCASSRSPTRSWRSAAALAAVVPRRPHAPASRPRSRPTGRSRLVLPPQPGRVARRQSLRGAALDSRDGAALVLLAAGLLLALVGGREPLARLAAAEWPADRPPRIATPVGAALYSLPFASVFVPRTLLSSLPALRSAWGCSSRRGRGRSPPWPPRSCWWALALGRRGSWRGTPSRPFGEAAGHIDDRAGPGDPCSNGTRLRQHRDRAHAAVPVYRQACAEPTTGPGQFVTGELRCALGRRASRPRLRGPGRRAFVLAHPGPPPAVPELERRWRLARRAPSRTTSPARGAGVRAPVSGAVARRRRRRACPAPLLVVGGITLVALALRLAASTRASSATSCSPT